MSGKFWVVAFLAYISSGCCLFNIHDSLQVDIVEAKITAEGFCRASLLVTNPSLVSFYLLERAGTYPELPVSVIDVATGRSKKLTIVATNSFSNYDCCQLVEVAKKSTLLLNIRFDVVGYNPSDHLAICVRSDVDPCCNIQKEIEMDCLSRVFKSKGDREYPHMSVREIESVKSDLLLKQQISR